MDFISQWAIQHIIYASYYGDVYLRDCMSNKTSHGRQSICKDQHHECLALCTVFTSTDRGPSILHILFSHNHMAKYYYLESWRIAPTKLSGCQIPNGFSQTLGTTNVRNH
ncbi:hypothetical protein M569_17284 [Genlisea aurea]|uniref:Uncharacterized protein n=1 Tax=Genlisea aurea TaxID=192259 RepID=S8D4E7_9LAMI|nr:hypothetical protein M569_17284 [Genlisea aurea]